MTLERFAVALLVVTAACGGSGATVGEAPLPGGGAVWTGTVNASQCAATGAQVPTLRCVAPSGSAPLATAVCGDLAADNTLTVGTLAVAGHSRTAAPLHVTGSFRGLGGIDATNTDASLRVASPMVVISGPSFDAAGCVIP